jgi:hypothetical protein
MIDPFAEADEDTGERKQAQNYIHIRIQRTYTLSHSTLFGGAVGCGFAICLT